MNDTTSARPRHGPDSGETEREEELSLLARAAEWLHLGAFCCAGAAVLVSPVLFGSWEMWWFWPMALLVFLACLLCGAGALVESALLPRGAPRAPHRHMPLRALAALALCVPFLLYASARALFPSGPGSPLVAMECERSLLLFFTPVALALVMLLSSRPAWRHRLLWCALGVAAAVSAIGLWSHFATGDTQVLWSQGMDFSYNGRLSGTFFCPNHLSAYENLFICLLLAAALTPRVARWKSTLFALAAAALLVPNFLSLSRGGLASLALGLAIAVPVFGLRGRSPWKRAVSVAAVVALAAAAALGARYASSVERFESDAVPSVRFVKPRPADLEYADGRAVRVRVAGFDKGQFHLFEEGAEKRVSVPAAQVSRVVFAPRAAGLTEGWRMGDCLRLVRRRELSDGSVRTVNRDCYGDVLRYEGGAWTERVYNPLMNRAAGHPLWRAWAGAENGAAFREKLHDAFWYSFDRGQYIGSALRAWRSNPVWGIGPGQHSNRWAEFEATPDGVRPDPDGPANAFKRPRHADYAKHLYEVHSDWTQLLEEYGLVGLALFLLPLGGVLWILYDRQRSVAAGDGPALARSLPLGALLYCIVLILHSFGDFSLQMPSIVWLLAFVLSSAVLENGLDET